MVTVDDVAKVVFDRVSGLSGYDEQLPGGLWYDRGPDNPGNYPYAVFEVFPGDAEITSGDPYVQSYTVRVAAYVQMDGTFTPNGVSQFLCTALGTTAANTAVQAATLRNAGEKVLGCKPTVAEGGYAPQRRQGQDLFLTGVTYEVLVQGSRGAS